MKHWEYAIAVLMMFAATVYLTTTAYHDGLEARDQHLCALCTGSVSPADEVVHTQCRALVPRDVAHIPGLPQEPEASNGS